jgi:hypothetical protein
MYSGSIYISGHLSSYRVFRPSLTPIGHPPEYEVSHRNGIEAQMWDPGVVTKIRPGLVPGNKEGYVKSHTIVFSNTDFPPTDLQYTLRDITIRKSKSNRLA